MFQCEAGEEPIRGHDIRHADHAAHPQSSAVYRGRVPAGARVDPDVTPPRRICSPPRTVWPRTYPQRGRQATQHEGKLNASLI